MTQQAHAMQYCTHNGMLLLLARSITRTQSFVDAQCPVHVICAAEHASSPLPQPRIRHITAPKTSTGSRQKSAAATTRFMLASPRETTSHNHQNTSPNYNSKHVLQYKPRKE
jgi:hypothetical protein